MMFAQIYGLAPSAQAGDEVNYNTVFGFGGQAERIDPHMHVQQRVVITDLSRIAELVRPKYLRQEQTSGERVNEQGRIND